MIGYGDILHFASLFRVPPRPLDVAHNSVFNLVGCLTYQGCQWLTTVLVVLLSGYDASGVLAYAMSIGNVYLSIATFNMRTYQVSDIDGRFTEGEYIAFRVFTIIVAFSLIIPYTLITTSNSNWILPIVIYLLFKCDEAICDVLSGISQKGGRMDYIGISQLARGIVVVAGFCFGLIVTDNLVMAVSMMFLCCLVITVSFDFPHARRFGDIDVTIEVRKIKCLIIEGLPLVLSATFASMIVTYARQAFGNQYGSAMLGYYAAVATPSVLVQAAARYLYSPVLVPLATKWEKESAASFVRYYVRSLFYIFIGVVCLAVLLLVFGPYLLEMVYGSEITKYCYLITVMVLSTGLNTFLYFMMDVLVIVRNLMGSVLSGAIGIAACVVFASPFIEFWGMDGLNYVIAGSYFLSLVVAAICFVASIKNKRNDESGDLKIERD